MDGHPTDPFRLLPASRPAVDASVGAALTLREAAVVLPAVGSSMWWPSRRWAGRNSILSTHLPSEMDRGSMLGVSGDDELTQLESFGMLNVEMTLDGSELQLAPGQTATIEIPIPSAELPDGVELPLEIPLWHLDEDTNQWREEGRAELDLERAYMWVKFNTFQRGMQTFRPRLHVSKDI